MAWDPVAKAKWEAEMDAIVGLTELGRTELLEGKPWRDEWFNVSPFYCVLTNWYAARREALGFEPRARIISKGTITAEDVARAIGDPAYPHGYEIYSVERLTKGQA